MYPSSLKVREEFLYTLYIFATKIKATEDFDTFEYVLKAMLQKLPQDNQGEDVCTAHYFELVSKLIEEYFNRVKESKIPDNIIDTPKFFADIIDRIKSHQSKEVRNSTKQDETLIGYLKMAHMIVGRSGVGDLVNIAIEKTLSTSCSKSVCSKTTYSLTLKTSPKAPICLRLCCSATNEKQTKVESGLTSCCGRFVTTHRSCSTKSLSSKCYLCAAALSCIPAGTTFQAATRGLQSIVESETSAVFAT